MKHNKRGKIHKLNQKKSFDYRKFFLIFLIVLFLLFFSYYGFNFFNKISGKSILNLEVTSQEGQPLEGNLKLSLKEGELIPSSSKIIIKNAGVEKEYELNEVISNNVIEGNFYVEGKSLTGSGEGYGRAGKKEIYPDVSFKLNIFSETKKTEKAPLGVYPEGTSPKDTELRGKEVKQEEKPTEQKEEPKEAEEVKEIVEIETEEETAPVTGNVITRFFRGISNSFLGLTGRASMKIETEIEGKVSKDKPFVYNLGKEQKKAEIISSSQDIGVSIEGSELIVSTDYYETELGFGGDYLDDETLEFSIDLSQLGLTAQEGELIISLVYDDLEIISVSDTISAEKPKEKVKENITEIVEEDVTITNESESEIPISPNQSIDLNETIANETIIEILPDVLSDKEKEVLVNKFGNVSMKMTKAEVFNERLIIRYELGDLWIEYSYDYPGEINEKVNSQIEKDRINWLKNLAYRFSQDETASEEIVNITKEIKIF